LRAALPAVALLLAAACSTGTPDLEGTSVLLVSVDTLRADRLPVYGYGDVATPSIDRLAAQSILFRRAYSHVPLTLPSHASLFTGRLPPRHGVRDNLAFRLADEETTLAERLRDAGYDTRGVVSSMVLRRETGIAQGFERFDDDMPRRGSLRRTFAQRRGDAAVEVAERWLAELAASERPFFLFVHLFDPHTPYDAPPPYAGTHDHPYDDEIAWIDALVGRLLDSVEGAGLDERTLVVLLSDHGEGLGDHVESEHGLTLYREAIHVPLMLRLPGGRDGGRKVAAPVGLTEVAPTLLALLGLPHDDLAGRVLVGRDLEEDAPIYGETQQPRLQYGWSALRSVVVGDLHYIEAPRAELFDLAQDPGEVRNLLPGASIPPAALWTLEDLGEGAMSTAAVDEETRRQLASLGYVGAAGAAERSGKADPKDHIAEIEELWALIRGEAPALDLDDARVRELLGNVAGNEALHRAAARSLLEQGRAALAAELLAGFEESDDPDTQVVLGLVAAARGRPGEALRRFDRALAVEPLHPAAWTGAGTVLLGAGRIEDARARLERAVELDPASAEAWNSLGAARIAGGDGAGALAAWRRATELDPDYADAWFNLAVAARGAGDREGAVDALRRYAALVDGADRERAQGMLRSLGASP
jgi:arylsulfatase A-like enzyme/Flp pilus assembly protein TadD